ncbi:MAG: pyruvate formate lyase family protein, partial [Oscillospiraceae bacterium]
MQFVNGTWSREINLRDFIVRNYTPYDGDESFLSPPTQDTLNLWDELKSKMAIERERGGVYDIDEKTISTITSHSAGYIDKPLEKIVGMQTDEPLKRAIMPFGGIRLVYNELEAYGKKMDDNVANVFKYRKTHNDGVFDAYTDEMKLARHTGIITGLPDAYGRGRIIGDYRRIALYGIDYLIEDKKKSKQNYVFDIMDSHVIRKREELSEQIRS